MNVYLLLAKYGPAHAGEVVDVYATPEAATKAILLFE